MKRQQAVLLSMGSAIGLAVALALHWGPWAARTGAVIGSVLGAALVVAWCFGEPVRFVSGGVVVGFALSFSAAWGWTHLSGPPPAPSPISRARGMSAAAPPAAGGDSGAELMGQVFVTVQALEDRIEADPDDADAYLELANLYLKVGKREEARGHLDRLLEREPENLHALTHLGILLAEAEDLEGARDRFQQTVELDAANWQGWFYLAVTEARLEHWEAARRSTARLEALRPDLPELADLRRHLAESDTGGAP